MNLVSLPASISYPPDSKIFRKERKARHSILNQKGQSFLEFILLLFVVLSLSLVITRGVNNGMGDRWTNLVRTITGHELKRPPNVELP